MVQFEVVPIQIRHDFSFVIVLNDIFNFGSEVIIIAMSRNGSFTSLTKK